MGSGLATCKRLNEAITARKNLRDFEQSTEMRGGVPKASLGGACEPVLRDEGA
jgi:hypothetical protein